MLESQNQREPTLKELRESLNLSQEDLGRRINLSYRTIAEWEGGRKMPRFDNGIRPKGVRASEGRHIRFAQSH
ncbi:helix-turn-helix domain-containing protein [Microseira wollei]|uniref:HTH cro/C1-type domain-containing protein n=1 Tax=Microseira wollei NIES-4236 TaxID=2530354 RepID=A0AAV3XHD3_9CYAN|nr:helix-turn-helix transcriptional regulator [Microseira wollei]GET39899.1 hypothetical protein MiSe_46710 [Microseira wollei NIES-4236]